MLATASASASASAAAPWRRHLKFMQPTQAVACSLLPAACSLPPPAPCCLLLSHMQMMFVDDPWKYSHTLTHTLEHTHPVRHIQFNIPYTSSCSLPPSASPCSPLACTPFTFSTSSTRCCRLIFIHFSHDNDAYYEFFVISRVLYFFFASLLSLFSFLRTRSVFLFIFSISLQRFRSPSNRQNNLHAA